MIFLNRIIKTINMKKITTFILLLCNLVILLLPSNTSYALEPNSDTFEGENFNVLFSVDSIWDDTFNATITITNISNSTLHNWCISFESPMIIENIWNASIVDYIDNRYTIKSTEWNQDIPSNMSISFGITATCSDFQFPQSYTLLGHTIDVSTDTYDILFNITNEWESGHIGSIIITNTSDITIEDWSLEFDYPHYISSIWNAILEENSGNHYILTNENYNQNIVPGESIEIGFQAENNSTLTSDKMISNVYLNMVSNIPIEPETTNIILNVSEKEIMQSSQPKTIYFYAQSSESYDTIILTDPQTQTVLTHMYDDGNYSTHGDDIAGDGIYSCKYSLDTSMAKEYEYQINATNNIASYCSNIISVEVYSPLTDSEINEISAVDTSIYNWTTSNAYKCMSLEERKITASDMLHNLAKNGTNAFPYSLIEDNSIVFHEDNSLYTFTYACGVLGGIYLKDFTDDFNSSSIFASTPQLANDASSLSSGTLGTARILYAFDADISTSLRYLSYLDLQKTLSNNGLNTSIDTDVTVSDFKNSLTGNNIIVFSLHGECYTFNSIDYPALIIREKMTNDKNRWYSQDLKKQRMAIVSGFYWILPNMFSDTYSNNELSDTLIFMENCKGFGDGKTENYLLADTLLNCGVSTVAGFHESVVSRYSFNIMSTYIQNILNGMSCKDSLNNCIGLYGANDYIWYTEIQKSDPTNYNGFNAYPILYGNENATLDTHTLKNGDFEDTINNIAGWNPIGDVRQITKLGNLSPISGNKMLFLSTGIGSAENKYLDGTQGSILQQAFTIPNDISTLELTYNVISEEPMEYVGSIYDDKFYIKLYTLDETELATVAYESVNSSQWISINNINFDGGDNTSFQTGWKTVQFDLSKYQQQTLLIKICICDTGDSAYDTAALIDNIVLK